MDSFFSLMNNAILLLALVVIYDAIGLQKITPSKYKSLLSGVFIGIIAISVMSNPWELRPGVFFDARWILLSISGLFFGFVPTLIATIFAVSFRVYLGGDGVYVGTFIIVISAISGLCWRYWLTKSNTKLTWKNILALSVAVEVIVIICLLLMPVSDRYTIISTISPTLLTVFTALSFLLGLLLKHRIDGQKLARELLHHKQLLETEKNLLQNIIDGIPDLIFYKSTDGKYLGCNKAFANALNRTLDEIKGHTDHDFFNTLKASKFTNEDTQVLTHKATLVYEDRVTSDNGMEHIYRTQKTPFTNVDGDILGTVGVSNDVAEKLHIEKQLQRSESTYHNIISTAQDGFLIASLEGKILEVNQSFANMTGYTTDELTSLSVNQIETDDKHQFSTRKLDQAKREKRFNYTSLHRHKQGHLYHVEVTVSYWDGDNGMFFCFVKDISERIEAEKKLLLSESKFRHIFERIPAISVQGYDKNRSVIFWNKASEKLYGYTREQALGKKLEDLIIPAPYRQDVINNVTSWLNEGIPIPAEELMLQRADGTSVPVYSSHTLINNTDNETEMYCIDIDLSAQKKAEEQALTLSQAIEQSPISMILTDTDSKIEYVNSAFEKITGYSAAEVLGQFTSMLKSGLTPKSLYSELWENITSGKTWQGELQNRKKNGDIFWEHAHIVPIFDNAGITKHYLALKQDVTQYKQQEEKILHQAHYDSLTGLPNRLLSLERLAQMLSQGKHDNSQVAVLFLDLDDFKKVNDTLGHSVGDELLIQAATRLQNTIRSDDVVGRLGGDEFIILLSDIHQPTDIEIAANKLLQQFYLPFQLEKRELVSTISIGIALYPNDSVDAKELLRQADSAMYHSKEQGRNTYTFFTHKMNNDMHRRLQLEESLRNALKNNELEVYFQPLVDIRNRNIIGAEALLRWHNPELGNVTPDEFIPIAEQTGLIISIGQFVLENAFSAAYHWQMYYNRQFKIAINVSPKQFRENKFVDMLTATLSQYDIQPSSVELEITEGVLLSGDQIINNNLTAINNIGVSISMDDFGTGYSSLSYLRSYPFDTLKVDKSFINDITVDPGDLELVSAAIAMSHGLNLRVVAEGIETEEQYQLLNALKCDYGQGYLFSKPLPQAEFEALLDAQHEPK
ncbi:EAL domain-containing protein [Shewanella phaeophyticola]|uniref:EAL domain-containing protein n=1 Tax=Shewanella phaeophyticola TaxID=2978345 RepID=A0ABT2P1V0_9GAMM|nr:EAL domain-containing protein [Shewanella sp. KJ10-1]MCT8985360.1 EAL domain-containing protein [Shewanella sp. KJ10-1]